MSENTSRIMTLPTLALRGVSVFPGTVLHFDVERPMSIAALNAAIGTDRMIFLVAQRDITCDTPRADDLYTVGAICRLSQILRTPGGGNVKCIVDGLYRAKLLRLTAEAPALWANVQVLADEPVETDPLECTALIRSCNDLFAEYAVWRIGRTRASYRITLRRISFCSRKKSSFFWRNARRSGAL